MYRRRTQPDQADGNGLDLHGVSPVKGILDEYPQPRLPDRRGLKGPYTIYS